MSVSSGLKATKIIGQRKAFYCQKIPEFSRAKKETVDIDILVTSRNGERKTMQSIRLTSRPDAFNKSKFITTFLIILGVTEILCSFKLVLEGKQVKRCLSHQDLSS